MVEENRVVISKVLLFGKKKRLEELYSVTIVNPCTGMKSPSSYVSGKYSFCEEKGEEEKFLAGGRGRTLGEKTLEGVIYPAKFIKKRPPKSEIIITRMKNFRRFVF